MRTRLSHFLLAFTLLVLSPLALRGQFVDWPPVPQVFDIFQFDSSFVLGAHTIYDPDTAKYALHMTFSQDYQNSVSSIKEKIANPVTARDSLSSARFKRSNAIGFKFVYLLDQLPTWVYDAKNLDAWFERVDPNRLQNFNFTTVLDKNWYEEDTVWETDVYKEEHPLVAQRFFRYLTVFARNTTDPSDTATTVLMAGDARFMRPVFAQSSQDKFDQLFHIWTDELGVDRDSATADSLAAIYDKSKVFDVSVAIRADAIQIVSPDVDSLDPIGYLNVFVRDTAQQGRPLTAISLDSVWVFDSTYTEPYYGGDLVERFAGHWQVQSATETPIESCKCAIYRPLVLDTITKLDYLQAEGDSTRHVGDEFVEIRTEFDPSSYIPIEPDIYWKYDDNPSHFGWASWDSRSRSYCAWLLEHRMGLASSNPLYLPPGSFVRHQRGTAFYPASVEESDVIYRFYTTRLVDLSLLRGRFSQRLTSLIDEGLADSLIREEYLTFLNDDTVNTMLNRIGIADEVSHRRYRAFSHVNSVVQNVMRDSNDLRGVWFNPPTNPDLNRVSTGDFDSLRAFIGDTNMKALHMSARQAYKLGMGHPVPVTYINPDKMSDYAVDTTFNGYRVDEVDSTFNGSGVLIRIDTTASRSIARAAEWDYRNYTDLIQHDILGSIYDLDDVQAALHDGGHIPSLARHIKASRFDYRNLSEYSHPVLNVIQTHGFYHRNGNKFKGGGFGSRQPTPEEILCMSWASVASNVNGLIFGDFQDDGTTIGIMRGMGDTSVADEYGDLYHTNHWVVNDFIPGMWLGRKSRYEAVREVTTELHHIDTLIGWRNLLYEQDQMSLHDTRSTFATMPMLDTVRAERAARHNYSYSTGTNTWTFNPSDTFDTQEETYMEVTQFYPSTGDSVSANADARYLLFVNRLTYPIDTNTYSAAAVALLDANALYTGTSSTTGFGAIDVRRPVVTLKNSTSTMADSFVVEKLSVEGTWIDTVAVGDDLSLDWLRPGRGALYRVTPIPAEISYAGTAYNNAVHAENLSTDNEEGDRLVVFERDSAVWLRRFHSTTGWSDEALISPAGDTNRIVPLGHRVAHTTTPALATARDDSATLIVWQRTDAATLSGTVEGIWVPGPPTSTNLASATSFTFSTPRTLSSPWMTLNPAVVGIDGGWVVAWGSPDDGIEVVTLRNSTNPAIATDLSNMVRIKSASADFHPAFPPVPLDPISKFPTLAYTPNADSNGHHVHMAWQQGQDSLLGGIGTGPYIMYVEFTVDFAGAGKPTFPLIKRIEHASQRLPGCEFLHPSIAVDSSRIGIAFESHIIMLNPGWPLTYPLGQISAITLRFRDSGYFGGTSAALPWLTTPYYWGDDTTRNVYPSLTQFPSRQLDSLAFSPSGALVWFDENSTEDHGRTAQEFYRYSDKGSVTLPPGVHPSMMLAPSVQYPPLSGTGVFYRGDTSTAVDGDNDWGEDRTWYSPHLLMEKTGAGFTGAFAAEPKSRGIFSGFTLGNWYLKIENECNFEAVSAGIVHHIDRDDDFNGTTPPGMPPSFFQMPENGDTWVDTIERVTLVSRTGTFSAPDNAVDVRIYVGRTDDITSWLDLYSYDSTMGSEPDVKIIPELIRASDSVVLWRSDTISTRDMVADYLDLNLSVPVDTYTTLGELVYVQVRPVATKDLGYDLSTGFHFFEGNSAPPLSKPAPFRDREENSTTGTADLAVEVVPNPVKASSAEVRVSMQEAGPVTIKIYTLLGEEVGVVTSPDGVSRGNYTVAMDLQHLPDGVYIVRAESGDLVGHHRFTLQR